MRAPRPLALLVLVPLLAGCAGGWRGGVAPAQWTAASAAVSSPASAAAPAGKSTGTHATADGAVFVWTGEGGTVNVAGEFNAWSTSADPMAKQANDTFTLTKKLAPGRYAYKFVVDGSNWKPDPSVADGVDDGFGGKNSVITVGGAATTGAAAAVAIAAPAKPAAAAAAGTGAGPAVSADGVVFKWAGGGNTVNLAGEFNAWSTSADPMAKQADGSFTLTKKLAAGRYAYKFVVDGGNWKEDPNAKETTDDGYGGKNAVVTVGGATAAAPAAAAPTAPAAAAAAPVTALAPGAKPRAPEQTANGVVFTYAGPATGGVALCGDFNSWATTADAMKQQADGTWTITRKLPAGSYAYKFLVDGSSWKKDDGNAHEQDDGFGGKNSVVTVK